MKKIVTWIVVADHQHARFFANEGPERGLIALEELSFDTKLAKSSDILTDNEGRGVASRDGRRHGMEGRTDPHRAEGQAFIATVARTVADAANAAKYDRLILVAPPRALGELRDALPAAIRKMVIGELAEDLTKTTIPELRGHLGGHLAV